MVIIHELLIIQGMLIMWREYQFGFDLASIHLTLQVSWYRGQRHIITKQR